MLTPRLHLRAARLDDVDALHAHWNDPQVRRFLFDDAAVPRAVVEEVVRASLDSFAERGWGTWVLTLRGAADSEVPVGTCSLRPLCAAPTAPAQSTPEEPRDFVEIVYSLDPAHWHRGLAHEAATAVLAHAFTTGLDGIVGGADPANTASLRLLQRLGLRPLGTLLVEGRSYPYFSAHRGDRAPAAYVDFSPRARDAPSSPAGQDD